MEQVIETKQPNLCDAALTGCWRNTKLTQLEGSENTKLPYAARATAEDTQLPDARSFQKVGQEKVVSWVAMQLAVGGFLGSGNSSGLASADQLPSGP